MVGVVNTGLHCQINEVTNIEGYKKSGGSGRLDFIVVKCPVSISICAGFESSCQYIWKKRGAFTRSPLSRISFITLYWPLPLPQPFDSLKWQYLAFSSLEAVPKCSCPSVLPYMTLGWIYLYTFLKLSWSWRLPQTPMRGLDWTL